MVQESEQITGSQKSKLKESLKEYRFLLDWFSNSPDAQEIYFEIVLCVIRVLKSGNKIIFIGNGGSAAEASHLAGEFVGKCLQDVGAQPAIALTDSGPILTAIANDWTFEEIFSRQINAIGRKGDLLIALSTSGKSINVLKGLQMGRSMGLYTSLWTSTQYKSTEDKIDYILKINSEKTTRIQEIHLFLGHLLCEYVEDLFQKDKFSLSESTEKRFQ